MTRTNILLLITPIIIFIAWEIFFYFPNFIYLIFGINVFLISFTIFYSKKANQSSTRLFNFLIFPILFQLALGLYALISLSYSLIHFLFVFNSLFLYFYLRFCFFYFLKSDVHKYEGITNISSFGNFFLFFLLSSAIYGLESFLNIPVWILSLVMVFVTFFVVYEVLWANKIDVKREIFYVCLICLILIELFWTLLFLPFNYNILGAVLAICYYMMIGITRHYLHQRLNKRLVKMYLGFGFSSIIIIILTAKWM